MQADQAILDPVSKKNKLSVAWHSSCPQHANAGQHCSRPGGMGELLLSCSGLVIFMRAVRSQLVLQCKLLLHCIQRLDYIRALHTAKLLLLPGHSWCKMVCHEQSCRLTVYACSSADKAGNEASSGSSDVEEAHLGVSGTAPVFLSR